MRTNAIVTVRLCKSLFAVNAVWMAWLASPLQAAVEINDPATASAIYQSLASRRHGERPMWLKYDKVEEVTSVFWSEMAQREAELAGAQGVRPIPPPSDFPEILTSRAQMELAFKGTRILSRADGPALSPRGLREQSRPTFHLFDGRRSVVFTDNKTANTYQPIYGLSADRTHALTTYATPWSTSGEDFLCRCCSDASIPRRRAILRPCASKWSALHNTHIHNRPSSSSRSFAMATKCVAPGSSLSLPTRCGAWSFFGERGNVGVQCAADDIRLIFGIPIPYAASRTFYDSQGRISQREKVSVTSVILDPRQIPDSLFTAEIPDGAAIFNLDTGEILRDPDLIQRYLESVQCDFGRDRRVWIAATVVAGIAVLVFLFFARWRRGGSKQAPR